MQKLLGIWQDIANIVTGFFAIIPQTLYFLFTSAASVVDMLQYAMRKLVGLDVYYINGEAQQGDILTDFIEGIVGINNSYSTLSTVFWAMIIFGVVLLVFATIISIIKSHYTYDSQKSNPMYIIGKAIKGLLTMVIIPLVTIFSLYLSEVLLQTLDKITTVSNDTTISEIYESSAVEKLETKVINNQRVYTGFSFFGTHFYSNSMSFSSSIFISAAYNSNRVRNGNYGVSTGEDEQNFSNAGIFWTDDGTQTKEKIALQIDTAFEYSLSLKDKETFSLKGDSLSLLTSYSGLSSLYAFDLINVKHFSKFNTGLVFYFYNLWTFDFLIGYAGIMTAVVLIFNIILGLCSRLIYLVALFLIYPPITSLFPFDDGNAVKSWRTAFTKMYLSSFSAVIGLNLMSIILPFLRTISFFNNTLIDSIMSSLFVLAALMVIKKLIAMFSKFIGAESIEEVGKKMSGEFKNVTMKAISDTLKIANVGIAAGKSLGKSIKNRKVRASKAKTKKGKFFAMLSPIGKPVKKSDRKAYDEQKKKDWDEKHNVDKRADELLEEDKKNATSKKRHSSDYNKRARARLEKLRPDMFEEGKKKGTTKIKEGMGDEYKKLMGEMKKTIAKEDARREAKENSKVTKFVRTIKKPFFQAEEKVKEWGKDPEKREEKVRPWVNEAISVTGQKIKIVGSLMGLDGIKKAVDEAGISDEFKETLKHGAGSMGIPIDLKTKKDKEDEEKAAIEAERESIQRTATIVQETSTQQINELTRAFETYYKKRLDREAEKAESKKAKKKTATPTDGGVASSTDTTGVTAEGKKPAKKPTISAEESAEDTRKYEEKQAKAKRSYQRRKAKEKEEEERKREIADRRKLDESMDQMKMVTKKNGGGDISRYESEVETARQNLETAQTDLEETQKRLRELEEEKEFARKKVDEAEIKLSETRKKQREKEEKITELQIKRANGEANLDELEKTRRELDEIGEEVFQANLDWQKLDESYSDVRRDISDIEDSIVHKKNGIQDAEYDLHKAEDLLSEAKRKASEEENDDDTTENNSSGDDTTENDDE